MFYLELLFFVVIEHWECLRSLSFEECFKMHSSKSRMGVWSSSYDHLLGRSVAPSLGQSVDRSIGRSLGRSLARSLVRSLGRSITRSLDRSIANTRSLGRSIARMPDRSIIPSLDRLIAGSTAGGVRYPSLSGCLSPPLPTQTSINFLKPALRLSEGLFNNLF